MKLNTQIEKYDVKSLQAMVSSLETVLSCCRRTREDAEIMQNNIRVSEPYFQTSNMDRAKEEIKKFSLKLSEAEREISELIVSAKDFAGRLSHIWRSWDN